MTKNSADANQEDAAPKEIIRAANEAIDRVVLPQIGDMAAFSREICQIMSQQFEAYAESMAELQTCQTLTDVWSVQMKLGRETFKAYSGGAAKLAGIALSTSSENVERLQRAA